MAGARIVRRWESLRLCLPADMKATAGGGAWRDDLGTAATTTVQAAAAAAAAVAEDHAVATCPATRPEPGPTQTGILG
eukprot:CAMPEP_0175187010 /NCGR_PEP_ID=MMETSP0093-20121207/2685_1 /TAXON_ID=311494 /ORGANISM="Alexandrium monilatum, Strain CCMP3105" /LENGTH=77 /DNA_ID=CAMNT_0016479747 /DNA_START=29 /DNA_END=258 /DNA_ORIENTATION=+